MCRRIFRVATVWPDWRLDILSRLLTGWCLRQILVGVGEYGDVFALHGGCEPADDGGGLATVRTFCPPVPSL